MQAAATTDRAIDAAAMDAGRGDAPGRAVESFGWYRARTYMAAFGGAGSRARVAAKRWRDRLTSEQVRQVGLAWLVRGDAELPANSQAPGVALSDFAQRDDEMHVAPEAMAGTERHRERTLAALQLVHDWRELVRRFPHAPSSNAFRREFDRLHGSFAREHGLSTAYKSMSRLDRAARRGEPMDGRVRSGRKRRELFDADILEECIGVYLNESKFDAAGMFGAYTFGRLKAKREGRVWAGSESTFIRRLNEKVPGPMRVYGRFGNHRFEADCIPKVHYDREQLAAGEIASLDGYDAKTLVRMPRARGGWKLTRPVEIVYFDVATMKAVAWHSSVSESAHGTLCALRRLCDAGGTRTIETDNGRGFNAALGSRKQWSQDDERLIGTACRILKITVRHHKKHTPWAKIAEGCFSVLKDTDRLSEFFIGGDTNERPEDVHARAKLNIDRVPTFEQYVAQREKDYALYNATPRESLGGLTPNLAYEQKLRETRHFDADLLEFACARFIGGAKGSRIVGRDGVSFNGLRYGQANEDVWKLQGRKVWLRMGPDAAFVWLCDQNGKPLAIATNERLSGATPDSLKRAERYKARLRKIAREYMRGREYMLASKVSQVREVLREGRRAEEAEQRRTLPAAQAPAVTLVSSELTEPVKQVKARNQRTRTRRIAKGLHNPNANVARNGFDVLAAGAPSDRPATHAAAPEADTMGLDDLYGDTMAEPTEALANAWEEYGEAAG